MNFINKNANNNIIYPKRISKSPLFYGHKYNYGEKIREKNNYTLYASGSGYERPQYEERQKRIKIIKNKNDNNNYNNINQKNKIIRIYQEENDELSYLDNYRYKETKDITGENPNLKTVTIHQRLGSPRRQLLSSPKRNKHIKIIRNEDIYWNKYYSPNKKINLNNGNKMHALRENKSFDYFIPSKNRNRNINIIKNQKRNGEFIKEITENDYNEYITNTNQDSKIETRNYGDYFIKVTTNRKEYIPPNNKYYNEYNNFYRRKNKDKNIKIVRNENENLYKNKNHEICDIYERKNISKDDYENEPYYIGNYGEEENYEEHDQYNACNNCKFKEIRKYGYNANNGYIKNMNKKENEYVEDIRDIKNIECPLHGKISVIIHKNPYAFH